jgi:hypothetical protein
MKYHLEEAIMRFYPRRALVSPLDNPEIRWTYDPKFQQLQALLAEVKEIDDSAEPGARAGFDIAEEVVLRGDVHVYLSYLGPFAAINHGHPDALDEAQQEARRAVERALARSKIDLLTDTELDEVVPWIVDNGGQPPATVWNCLFDARAGA